MENTIQDGQYFFVEVKLLDKNLRKYLIAIELKKSEWFWSFYTRKIDMDVCLKEAMSKSAEIFSYYKSYLGVSMRIA